MMIKKILFFYLIFNLFPTFAQINEDLTAEERAYLFHIVKKSEILDQNIGRYFDYKGPMIYFSNKNLNYDSIELIIINQPELLIIRKEEITKSTKGILAEAANKMALWELNKTLQAKRISEKELEPYLKKYKHFENYLIEKMPEEALRLKENVQELNPKIIQLLNPTLNFDDKIAYLESLRFKNPHTDKAIIDAISYAINQYVKDRTLQIFQSLGGESSEFKNILVAAGDGSSTSGILDEKEKDDKGRWNKGLPKAVGFFPYQTYIEQIGEKKKSEVVKSKLYAITDFKTYGQNRHTDIHFDVWGYNTEKQTTVVLERNGWSYPLFGSGQTRFLSPDSSFSNGYTFMAIINDLKNNKIAKLNELIYGKKGYEAQIADNTDKMNEVELKIEKNEFGYSSLTNDPITTRKNAPSSVKRAKKKAFKNGTVIEKTFQPKTDSNKKQKGKSSNTIVDLYNQFDFYKRRIAELEAEKATALDKLALYKQKLDLYNRLIGMKWRKFTEENGIYTFEDSCTFNIFTQDFRFPAKDSSENVEIRLIAIPESSISNQADEVMLHISSSDIVPGKDARLQLDLLDVFASNQYQLNSTLIHKKDSVAVLQFFESMLNKDKIFKIIARGQGVGTWNGAKTVKNLHPVSLDKYETSREDGQYVRLRSSLISIQLQENITLEVNSYTDPVKSNFKSNNENINTLIEKYKLSENDLLSAYRTAEILKKIKEEINVLAGLYLNREQAKIVIDKFNKEYNKAKVSIGITSIKLIDF